MNHYCFVCIYYQYGNYPHLVTKKVKQKEKKMQKKEFL